MTDVAFHAHVRTLEEAGVPWQEAIAIVAAEQAERERHAS